MIGIIILICLIVLGILWYFGYMGKIGMGKIGMGKIGMGKIGMDKIGMNKINIDEINISYFSIISSVVNLIGLVMYAYSVHISQNIIEPPSRIVEYGLFGSYLFLFYITFIIILGYLGLNTILNENKLYILVNSIFLIIMTPLIIYRDKFWKFSIDDISHDDWMKTREEGGAVDVTEYDEKGNRKVITDESKLEVRKRAAEAEYNERKDIEEGIYD